jgi:hypothetical protein
MLPLLAAIFLEWHDPAGLVGDLSADSIELRDRAARELYRRGEGIRTLLLEAQETAADLETRARLEQLLRRLDADARIREFGGGNRVGGFGLALGTDRYFGAGPFKLSVAVMNLGPDDQILAGIGTWDLELPDQDIRSVGSEARVGIRRFAGAAGLRRSSWRPGGGPAGTPVLLRPGDCARFEYALDAKSLPAGDYQVAVEYFARDLIPGADENLRSNTVHLMIRK